ncbi:VOC family protein [Microcoleus sp. D3_18a_C4]|uniref:VOC family protein n=1 Tax=unclassified Microcoleus TaxID=2642155 RepID=UPI002FD4A9E5
MVANPPEDMPRIAPHLFYDDVGAAIDWLVEAFGFVIRVRMTDDNGLVVHGELEVEDKNSLVMLGLAAENAAWESPRTLNGLISQRLYIYVDNVDAHAERARKAGAKFVYEPVTHFYGDRVYECEDPEGHRWKFAQHVQDVDMSTLKRPPDIK